MPREPMHDPLGRYIVVKALSPIGDTPASEAQAWPLTRIRDKAGKLDLPRGKRVWTKVVTIYPLSAGGVRHLTAKRIEPIVTAREGNRILREELGRKRIIPADSQKLVDRAVANLLLTRVSGVVFPSAQRRLLTVETAHFSKS